MDAKKPNTVSTPPKYGGGATSSGEEKSDSESKSQQQHAVSSWIMEQYLQTNTSTSVECKDMISEGVRKDFAAALKIAVERRDVSEALTIIEAVAKKDMTEALKISSWIMDRYLQVKTAVEREDQKDIITGKNNMGEALTIGEEDMTEALKITCYVAFRVEIFVRSKIALESSKRATQVSPRSIDLSRRYVTLLHYESEFDYLEFRDSEEDWEAVIRECERGLSIQDPIIGVAPNHNHSSEQSQSQSLRIAELQEDLQNFLNLSKSRLIQTKIRGKQNPYYLPALWYVEEIGLVDEEWRWNRGRMASNNGGPHLPEDLTIEILARVPMKSLLRFKCVYKLVMIHCCSPNHIVIAVCSLYHA